MASNPPVVVLIGGNGSNLQALIDYQPSTAYRIAGVVSHVPEVFGLQRAKNSNIPTAVIDHTKFENRESFERALLAAVLGFSPKIVVLAGFMRVLTPLFIQECRLPILNIHPSLLPKYKGLHTHRQALAAKEKEHGVSVHFVNEALDGGPLIAQIKVPVFEEDTESLLAKRVLVAEHWLYPQVVSWLAQNRLKCDHNTVTLDGQVVPVHGLQLSLPTAQGVVS